MDITVQELKQKLDAGENFVFLDVREQWEHAEANLGARLIPLAMLPSIIPELAAHKDDEIVIHCRSGARSGVAQAMLQAQGFKNVRNLTGGILAWQSAQF
ncbi:MAG TPA: rhodanese-like domain-containing protein [Saprospiraceae bacterium]|nr:rhodanese-like domain-containing protein [Saprospiraceae bacterium]HND86684.1 rhodanese-like domain-containing protein [Saprospiraceae bacterium]HNG88858.1 rhodanese-like domain-containing protein [Saprospiraceae bacterium]